MGTGKSSVGKLVAKELHREFVDADHEIEKREHSDIPAIFANAGEPHFRKVESEVIRDLSARENLVIAPGGGAVINPVNVENLAKTGVVICLRAKPETILERIGHDMNRPLLRAPDRMERIRELLAKRKTAYDSIPLQIETDGLATREVGRRVIDLFNAAIAGRA
jgi:shikimate kinase